MGAFARPPIFLRRSHHTSLTLPDPRLFIIRVSAELIRSKGDQTMTVEQLTAEIIPRGRGARSIPARQRTLYASRAPRPPPRRLLTASSHRLCAACRDGAGRDQVRAAAADTALRRAAVVSARGTARRRCRGLGRRGWGRGDPSCLKHAVGSSQLLWSRRTRGHREQAEIRAEGRRWGSQHAHRRRREVSCGRRGARQTRVCSVAGRRSAALPLALAAVASRASHFKSLGPSSSTLVVHCTVRLYEINPQLYRIHFVLCCAGGGGDCFSFSAPDTSSGPPGSP